MSDYNDKSKCLQRFGPSDVEECNKNNPRKFIDIIVYNNLMDFSTYRSVADITKSMLCRGLFPSEWGRDTIEEVINVRQRELNQMVHADIIERHPTSDGLFRLNKNGFDWKYYYPDVFDEKYINDIIVYNNQSYDKTLSYFKRLKNPDTKFSKLQNWIYDNFNDDIISFNKIFNFIKNDNNIYSNLMSKFNGSKKREDNWLRCDLNRLYACGVLIRLDDDGEPTLNTKGKKFMVKVNKKFNPNKLNSYISELENYV